MTANMPQVNAEFGAAPVITFPSEQAPAGRKAEELVAGTGPMVRRGDSPFDSSFDRHQPARFGIGIGQVIQGWDRTLPGHNVGSRLLVSIPPEYGYGHQGMPQAGIGGDDTLVFVVDIISTR